MVSDNLWSTCTCILVN